MQNQTQEENVVQYDMTNLIFDKEEGGYKYYKHGELVSTALLIFYDMYILSDTDYNDCHLLCYPFSFTEMCGDY